MGLNCSKTIDQDLELAPNFLAENVTCYYEKPGIEIVYKFYLVAVFGTSIALISFVENTPLVYVFLRRQHFRQSHYFYLMFLAFFDIFIATSYIMLFTVQVLFDYLESPGLSATWHFYLSPIFTVSKVSLAAAGYLVVATTLERFLVTNRLVSYAFDQTCRSLAVVFSIFAAVLFNGMVYFEVTVIETPNCTNMARYAASPTSLMENSAYKAIFTFWIRNIFTVILPFLLLASMNVSIVLRMLTDQESAKRFYNQASSIICRKRFGSGAGEGQKNLQLATRTLVLIVTSYLIANVPSVILTTWEFVDFNRLHSINQGKFYSFAADVVSILTVVCGALRLPIYVYCNQKVSRELKNLLMMKICLNDDSGPSPASSTFCRTSAVRYVESKEMQEFVPKYNRVSVSALKSPRRSQQDDYSSGFNSRSSVDVEIAHTRIWDPIISDGGTAL